MATPTKTKEDELVTQRNTKTLRSPVNQTHYKRMRSHGDETEFNDNKTLTFGEMKGYVDALSEQLSNNHKKDIEENVTNSLTIITNQLSQLTNRIQSIENSITSLDERVSAVERLSSQNTIANERKIMSNMIKQGKIENVMEITGIYTSRIQAEPNLKQLAVNTIQSFNIPIETEDIVKVSKREIEFTHKSGKTQKETKLLVTFADMDKKIEVMKHKSRIKENVNIFFNIALTPLNSYLMRKAKAMLKGRNIRVTFRDNAIKIKKLDGNDITLVDEDDLKVLENYVASFRNTIDNNMETE
ncbi:hypothetical protein PVAND_004269 [Polypedilum vanderplanki]|uniref:Uncharacterized protein n=1 Tax=Polypedilum vanderplanki TaxID=319348 RepID=A0A9J6BXL6_POLVA|nr:hypothetical protein PVAND_004269 [Polypedilum vanderplanki]